MRSIVLGGCCVMLISSCASDAAPADSVERPAAVEELLGAFDRQGATPAPAAEFTPPCFEGADLLTVDGVSKEIESEELGIGALRLAVTLPGPADAETYLDLWRTDPWDCLQLEPAPVVTDLDVPGDDVLRWTYFPGGAFSQEFVAVVNGAEVVLVAMTIEGSPLDPAQIDDILQAIATSS